MHIADTIAFVTGANRGLGRALVDALLAAGAKKVYAASRDGNPGIVDARVVPVALDITDPAQVRAAAAAAPDVRILINNAGSLASFSVLDAEPKQIRHDLEVNFHGVLALVRAFVPSLATNGGAVVNVLSIASFAAMPALGGYSASKAAAWSLTQALRAELRAKKIAVHAVFPGPIDTDMIRTFTMAKASPASVAQAIVDGVREGQEDIAPDPVSTSVAATFAKDPRAIEQQFGAG